MSTTDLPPCVEIFWIIKNFSWLKDELKELTSPSFFPNPLNKSSCSLLLKQVDTSKVIKLYASFLLISSEHYTKDTIKYEFCVLDQRGFPISSSRSPEEELFSVKWTEFLERNEQYFPQDVLTIRCRVWKTDKSLETFKVFLRTEPKKKNAFFVWDIENFSRDYISVQKTVPIRFFPGLPDPPFRLIYSRFPNTEHIKLIIRKKIDKLESWSCHLKIFESDELYLSTPDYNFKPHIFNEDITPLSNPIKKRGSVISPSLFAATPIFSASCKKNTNTSVSLPEEHKLAPLINYQVLLDRKIFLRNDTLSLKCKFTLNIREFGSTFNVFCGTESKLSPPPWAVHVTNSDVSLHYQSTRLFHTESRFLQSYSVLQQNWAKLYNDPFQRDFTIKVQSSHNYPVHSLVLSARSPVFREMFESKMKENTDRNILLEDVEPIIISQMLQYMYTGELANLTIKSCIELFNAGEKYQMAGFKDYCIDFLRNNLHVSSACAILEFTDKHQIEDFKYEVVRFISRHEREVVFSSEWRSLMQSNSFLTSTTMLSLIAAKTFA